jgi:hypothetical protein
VALALALNLAVLGLVGRMSSLSGSMTAPVASPGRTVVLLPEPELVAAAPAPTLSARVPTAALAAATVAATDEAQPVTPATGATGAIEEAVPAAPRDTGANMNAAADSDTDLDAAVAALHSTALTLTRTSDPAQSTRFYAYAEVDRAAKPEHDWNIDLAALDALGLERLVFEVFISDTGQIVDCTVLAPTGLPEDSRHALEQRLLETRLTPALRAGQAVASRRRIEMLVSTTPAPTALANVTAASLRPDAR